MLLIIKNSILPPTMRCEKMLQLIIVGLQKVYKFAIGQFLIGHVVFVLIIKNNIIHKKIEV